MTTVDDRARRATAEARAALERATSPPDLGPLAARRARRRRAGAGVLVVLAVVGAGLAYRADDDDGRVRVGTGPEAAAGQLMSCGDGVLFPIGALEGPTGAEQGESPAAAALRRELPDAVQEPGGTGWRVLSSSDDTVAFGNVAGAEVLTVVVDRHGDEWTVTSVRECRPVPYRPGHRAAGWTVDPGRPPSRDDSVVHVRVREQTCTTARAPGDRLAEPLVERSSGAVTVTFFERLGASDRRCTNNPSVPVTVDLGEPIGDRELRDGSTWPATPQPVGTAGGTLGGFAAHGGCGDVFLWAADAGGTTLLAVAVDGAMASAPGVVEVDLPSDRATVEVRRGRDLTGLVCTDLPSPDAVEDAVMPAVAGRLRLTLGAPAADGTAVADLVVTGVEVEGPNGERLPVEDVTVEDVVVGWFAG